MKKCIKCGLIKELSQFYTHYKMTDGHLNECKICTRIRTNKDYRFKVNHNPYFVEQEALRARQKYYRLYSSSEYIRWQNKNGSNERRAHSAAQTLTRPFKDAEAHHWSYNEEHFKDVIWLTFKQHKKAHRFLIYHSECGLYSGIYYDILLNTKESHQGYINWCIDNLED